jgi:hypothetical protein
MFNSVNATRGSGAGASSDWQYGVVGEKKVVRSVYLKDGGSRKE